MNKLAIACEMSLNDWLATFPDEIPKAECSKKHEKWKKKLFNKMRDDHYHRYTTQTIKVMLVAAVLFALLLTAFVIPSSREFMLDNLDHFSRYKITENNKNSIIGEITVRYVPEDFKIIESIDMGKHQCVKYIHTNGNFFAVFKYTSSMEVDFNTEFSETEEIIVDDIKYVYCKGDKGVDNLIWTKNDYVYRISGPFTLEELLTIAKTVE